jgi:hypothetical protein
MTRIDGTEMDFELGRVMGYTGPQELKENREILPGCLRVVTPLPRRCPVSLKIRGMYGAYTGHIRGILHFDMPLAWQYRALFTV